MKDLIFLDQLSVEMWPIRTNQDANAGDASLFLIISGFARLD